MSDDPRQLVRESLEKKSSEELQEIWDANDRQKYSGEDMEFIGQVLRSRGIEPPSRPDPIHGMGAEKNYRGVKGWLLFFCISLTILFPLGTAVNIIKGFSHLDALASRFPGLVQVAYTDLIIGVILTLFSIYAGYCLWRVKPGAVKLAKWLLLSLVLYGVFTYLQPSFAGLPPAAETAMRSEMIKTLVRSVVGSGIWFWYLKRSKRVKATYGEA